MVCCHPVENYLNSQGFVSIIYICLKSNTDLNHKISLLNQKANTIQLPSCSKQQ